MSRCINGPGRLRSFVNMFALTVFDEVARSIREDLHHKSASTCHVLPMESFSISASTTDDEFFMRVVGSLGNAPPETVFRVTQNVPGRRPETENGFDNLAIYKVVDVVGSPIVPDGATGDLIRSGSQIALTRTRSAAAPDASEATGGVLADGSSKIVSMRAPTVLEACVPVLGDGGGSIRIREERALIAGHRAMFGAMGLSAPPMREWTRTSSEDSEFPWFQELQFTRPAVDRRSGFGYPVVPEGFRVVLDRRSMEWFLDLFPPSEEQPRHPQPCFTVEDLRPLLTSEALRLLQDAERFATGGHSPFLEKPAARELALAKGPFHFLRAMALASRTCQYFPHLRWYHFYTHVCRTRLRATYEFSPKMNHILEHKGVRRDDIRAAFQALRDFEFPAAPSLPHLGAWCKLADAAAMEARGRQLSVYTQEGLRRRSFFLVESANRLMR